MRRDLDDPLARCLHADGGYRYLAAERPVVPTGLPQPFDELVCAAEVTRRASGALMDTATFESVRDWPVLSALRRRVVNPEGAEVLRKLGFDGIRPVALSGLLRDEMGTDKRIDPERGKRLGEVITPGGIVDEAHHLGTDKKTGPTLAYGLLSDLAARRRIESLLFFTGTPHRGRDFGFFGLMHLVRPDLFDPEGDAAEQLRRLPQAMIRNNKAAVTDLRGNRLFQPVTVHSREYAYSDTESRFYDTLSQFILDGRAYAATLDGRAQTARMLVLTSLQKLAASSIVAIRNALRKRRAMLAAKVGQTHVDASVHLPDDEQATLDDVAEAEERLPTFAAVLLLRDEIRRLDELVELSEAVTAETKIDRLTTMIRDEFPAGEPVLLFTEYKATQALVVNALHRQFGFGSAAFINGDDRLDGLEQASGTTATVAQPREQAASAFNAGRVRFLVSTEAGGEGIDLQERCAVLVHVDMPWNPMRLHQRVGRLSRYGQSRPVSAYLLRNPNTVEARIWDLLNEKLERVQQALSSVMEQPEDISQLVVGMTGSSVFNELFSGAQGMTGERLTAWFDTATTTLGGRDVIEAVREMLGNVSRFDFQTCGRDLPQVDIPDLERFFTLAAGRHKRRVRKRADGLEVTAPDA